LRSIWSWDCDDHRLVPDMQRAYLVHSGSHRSDGVSVRQLRERGYSGQDQQSVWYPSPMPPSSAGAWGGREALMPSRAPRPCSHPGCPRLVRGSSRLCDAHQAEKWRRDSVRRRARGEELDYGPRWRQIRARLLKDRPLCQRCGRSKATVAHHIVRRRDGGSDELNNLLAVCPLCHAQIHAEAKELFGGPK